jgi:hypothetical protein
MACSRPRRLSSQPSAPALVAASVESVTLGGGQSGLALSLQGLGDVPFSDVRQIGSGADAAKTP